MVHGHARRAGSKTDKARGAVIKCFSSAKDAYAMHSAIVHSEERRARSRRK